MATRTKTTRTKPGSATRPRNGASANARSAKRAATAHTGDGGVPARAGEKVREVAAHPVQAVADMPRQATLAAARTAGRRVLDRAADAGRTLAEAARENRMGSIAERVRRLPIQRSIDVGVPLEVAWDEWLELEFLPEGAHRVEDIERDGDDRLAGRISGLKVAADWEAKILDERQDESFAWRSDRGSDCAGLITFHRLGDRLTRLELQLDMVPSRLGEAVSLAAHLADRRADADLRRFKARVETLSPDDYPPLDDEGPDDEEES